MKQDRSLSQESVEHPLIKALHPEYAWETLSHAEREQWIRWAHRVDEGPLVSVWSVNKGQEWSPRIQDHRFQGQDRTGFQGGDSSGYWINAKGECLGAGSTQEHEGTVLFSALSPIEQKRIRDHSMSWQDYERLRGIALDPQEWQFLKQSQSIQNAETGTTWNPLKKEDRIGFSLAIGGSFEQWVKAVSDYYEEGVLSEVNVSWRECALSIEPLSMSSSHDRDSAKESVTWHHFHGERVRAVCMNYSNKSDSQEQGIWMIQDPKRPDHMIRVERHHFQTWTPHTALEKKEEKNVTPVKEIDSPSVGPRPKRF